MQNIVFLCVKSLVRAVWGKVSRAHASKASVWKVRRIQYEPICTLFELACGRNVRQAARSSGLTYSKIIFCSALSRKYVFIWVINVDSFNVSEHRITVNESTLNRHWFYTKISWCNHLNRSIILLFSTNTLPTRILSEILIKRILLGAFYSN